MTTPAHRKTRPAWLEAAETILLALVLAFLLRTFVLESFQVSGSSMYPTLLNGQGVLVFKLAYLFQPPETGQIVVFRAPVTPNEDWIKRVIATPGEVVSIRRGQVYLDGKKLDEPYIRRNYAYNYGPARVPPGSLFVLGDNRPVSRDSRYFGFLKDSAVRGKAFVAWWPFGHFHLL
ncbi:MAG: signal peptidase I [Actinomycetia bacterium]|nr:signal peptidase I [Actinomycetes bacterium]